MKIRTYEIPEFLLMEIYRVLIRQRLDHRECPNCWVWFIPNDAATRETELILNSLKAAYPELFN